ncbi:MAG: HAMP domain-containing histidine kinase [Micromonosporaceae bacterium]|nr:HAMP domain-containing histidine kinase [Micromonosporaceae bacterium]
MIPRHWTIRVRLTVLYGGLFFLAGAVLLGLTYVLVRESIDKPRFEGGMVLEQLPEVIRARFDPQAVANLQEVIRREQEAFQQQTLNSLLTQGSIALGLVGVVAVGFGWLMAERVLRPLHRITETAARIAAGTGAALHERIALTGPRDEIAQLADTFDAMLERLDRSFDGQRRFVANASHELRTPLAINRALIELAVSRPGAAEETRQLGESLLAINARHERLIDGLLMLAESENLVTERSTVDLADVVARVLGASPPDSVDLRSRLAPAPTTGDPVLIERLVQNLVENGIRHNVAAGGWVEVTTRTVGDDAQLVVSNTGPVVAPYEVETIFQPFRRLGSVRTGPERGFGLGLSIVAAIVRGHGGRVVAVPREGGGLRVTVTLPGRAGRT